MNTENMSEKEKVKGKFINGLILEWRKVGHEMDSGNIGDVSQGFNGAWDIQQSKINELVEALERINKYDIVVNVQGLIAHEALKKYKGE